MNLFIIGAGFTRAVFPDAPLNGDLLSALTGNNAMSGAAELASRFQTNDIEIALTKLDIEANSCPDGSNYSLRRRVEIEIVRCFGRFCVSDSTLDQKLWLASAIENVFQPGDVVISLNYDCVLEGLLDCRRKWSPNGGYGYLRHPLTDNHLEISPITVLKIHGSINFSIAPYADKPDAAGLGFIFDEQFFPRSARHTHFRFGGQGARPYVIAPSYVKIPTVDITYLMLDALEASTRAKKIVVIGSALRQEDSFLQMLLTNFLRQPSWRDRRIVVVDPHAVKISDKIKRYWGVDVSQQVLPINANLEMGVSRLLDAMQTGASYSPQ